MAWSYSRWSTYKQCPAKHNFAYVLKIPTEQIASPAMERGTRLHNSAERFMLGETDQLDPELAFYTDYFAQLRGLGPVHPERKWCFDVDWNPVAWDSPDGFIRGILDLHVPSKEYGNMVLEYKTGKIYPEHQEQRGLYGIAATILEPEFDRVEVINVYFDQKKNEANSYQPNMMKTLAYLWTQNIKRAEQDTTAAPNPSFKCRWCNYSKQNGGPCQF